MADDLGLAGHDDHGRSSVGFGAGDRSRALHDGDRASEHEFDKEESSLAGWLAGWQCILKTMQYKRWILDIDIGIFLVDYVKDFNMFELEKRKLA